MKIKYIGTQDNWCEVSVTGNQCVWQIAQADFRTDAECALLLATGLFERAELTPVFATKDLTGGIGISLGDAYPVTPAKAARNSIVFYGDSHQQKGHGADRSATVKYEYFYADCMPWWIQALSQCRFNIVGWRAIGGRTTTQILSWIDQVLSLNPGVVVLNGGTNDALVDNLIDYTIPLANIEKIWSILTSHGIHVITVTPIITDPTVFSAVTNPAASKDLMLKTLRLAMIERAPYFPGVTLVDAYGIGVDPLSATGAQKTNYLRTDKVHTSNLYAYKLGKAIAAAIDAVIPPMSRLVASVADTYTTTGQGASRNRMTNSLFTTTSGGTAGMGASGTVPSGWTVSRASGASGTAVAVSNAARADGIGNDMVLTVTGDAAETNGLITAEFPLTMTGVVEGAGYYAKCEVTVGASPAALKSVYMRLTSDSVNPTSTYIAECGHSDSIVGGSMYALEEGYTAVYETPECIAQPGVTAGNFKIRIGIYVGASASAVIKIGRISAHQKISYPADMSAIEGGT